MVLKALSLWPFQDEVSSAFESLRAVSALKELRVTAPLKGF